MINFAPTTRLSVLLIGAAVAGALAPGASAKTSGSDNQIYVNPSTGFPTPAATAHRKLYVNPSTGFASRSVEPSHEVSRPAGSQPAIDKPGPGGFDWPSAAIGAAATGGLLVILLAATIGVGRRGRGRLVRRGAVRT